MLEGGVPPPWQGVKNWTITKFAMPELAVSQRLLGGGGGGGQELQPPGP